MGNCLNLLLCINIKIMIVLSKFLDTGKKYYLNKKYCAWHTNVLNEDISVSSNCDLFYPPPPLLFFRKYISFLCKTCFQASPKRILNDPNLSFLYKAYNVIYKINCNICGLICIDETSTPVHLRINQHQSNFECYNSNTNYCKSTVELQHFNLYKF